MSDQVVIHQLKGDIFYAQEHLENALRSFQDSLDLNPDAYFAIHPHHRKALILARLGRYQEALNTCGQALSLYPDQPKIHELKAKILKLLN
ncbi:MAG: tetratricopeptide repeat protein [Leptolyngbyaceae cyanobacterium SM2_5_2]|nr:tetratricopeptide repeat protein [Leptolyngbyaceae cyanobacterium SM2_5_2]